MPEHTVRGSALRCPDCYGSEFSKKPQLLEHKWLFFTRKEAFHNYECDGCGFSYIIK